jgi:hypothetical protein
MMTGISPTQLDDRDLMRELGQLHRTRNDTFLHATADALAMHTARTHELEAEYLRRHPERAVTSARTRDGARAVASRD